MQSYAYWRHEPELSVPYKSEGIGGGRGKKDLGVLITYDLKASQQCTAACNKANRVLRMMNRTVVYKSKKVLLNLYKSSVRPRVEYCTPLWSPCYQKDKTLIGRPL